MLRWRGGGASRHWPHAELPEDFLEVVNDWFQRPENVLDPLGGGPGADAFFPRT